MSLNLYMTVASLQANISDQVTGTNDSEIKNETVLPAVLASLERSKKAETIVAELFGIENSMQNHANTKFNEMIAEVKKLHTRSRPRWRPKPRLRPRFRKPAEPAWSSSSASALRSAGRFLPSPLSPEPLPCQWLTASEGSLRFF